MSERQGVEIDYCPECRGVWLDRGELDKLIVGEEKAYAGNQQSAPDNQRYVDDSRNDRHSHDDKHDKHSQPRKHKRESFLGEIFEMFGD